MTDTPGATAPALPAERDFSAAPPPSALGRTVLALFVAVPLTALLVAVPVCLANGWFRPVDAVMFVVLYYIGLHGVTVGYHRLFTHRGFRPNRAVKIALAIAGGVAVEGRISDWVADHRRHHQFSDRDGDPHSPWGHGPGLRGLIAGLLHAHVGWLFTHQGTRVEQYAPDILADRDLRAVARWWPAIAIASIGAPAVVGAFWGGWSGAAIGLVWSLARLAVMNHVTWSVNSVCHVWGRHPFTSRDRSGNVAWLAPLACGENFHNYHHADPSSARHGVLPGQLDTSAMIIRLLERAGWVTHVKWPSAERIEARRAPVA